MRPARRGARRARSPGRRPDFAEGFRHARSAKPGVTLRAAAPRTGNARIRGDRRNSNPWLNDWQHGVLAAAVVAGVLDLTVWVFTDIDWLPAVLVIGAIATGVILGVLEPPK
jgi:hypothetical protein